VSVPVLLSVPLTLLWGITRSESGSRDAGLEYRNEQQWQTVKILLHSTKKAIKRLSWFASSPAEEAPRFLGRVGIYNLTVLSCLRARQREDAAAPAFFLSCPVLPSGVCSLMEVWLIVD
jgi:hypothetical protein